MTVDFEALRQVEAATVYKKDRVAGRLARHPSGVDFRYDESYLDTDSTAVASTLPLTSEPFTAPAGALPPYFSGLLPEGRRLSALRAAVKTSADDELSLLLAVGADAVGDVRVVPDGTDPLEVSPRVEVRRWDELSFAEVLAAETGADPDRVALPGAQPKASARMISFPVRRGSSRFILKLDPPEFPMLCRNEWLMLQVARACALPTASAELVTDREGREALAVQRFDRTPTGGLLAVEDACQALGRYPADKYNVTTETACAALSRLGDAPLVVARTLLRWVAFAYVTCNGDLHAKNLAVAERPDGTYQAAPAYDLPSSYPYGDVTLALPINGKSREDVGRANLIALAESLGVLAKAAGKVVDEVVAGTVPWAERLAESGLPEHTVAKWRKAMLYRCARLER